MKERDIDTRIMQTLKVFESLEDIQASPGFNQLLNDRIAGNRMAPETNYQTASSAVVLLFVILINIGIILTFSNISSRSLQRGNELRAISKEFLINPTSIKG